MSRHLRATRVALAMLLSFVSLAPIARADDDEGKQHFMLGVKLFQGANHIGALAEFEEAFRLRPTANALLNIALCQKALFRYADAIATLDRLLRDFGATLSDADRKATESAIAELRPLVVRVELVVTPADAKVTIDGVAMPTATEVQGAPGPPSASGTPATPTTRTVSMSVGEHKIHVEAPFFRAIDRIELVAGNTRRIEVTLVAESGKLVIGAEEDAAISVDGAVRGYGHWSGDITTGRDHNVQVFKPGFKTRELNVHLAAGETLPIAFPKLDRYDGDNAPPTPLPYTPPSSKHRGLYLMLSATTYYLIGDPDDFALQTHRIAPRLGTFVGGRVGYRVVPAVGFELAMEYGGHDVGPGCYPTSNLCNAVFGNKPTYELNTLRTGMNVRYFLPVTSSGDTALVGVAGVGYAYNSVTMPPANTASTPPYPEGNVKGGNFYGTLEMGIQFMLSNVLLEPVLTMVVEGASGLKTGVTKSGYAPQHVYSDDSNLVLLGAGVRVGYAFW